MGALCWAVDGESHLLTQCKTLSLMQQKSSVERGKLGFESGAGQLQQALVLVQGLASNVTEWGTNLSDTQSKALEDIKSFIETMIANAHTSHTEDQNEVDRAEGLIGGCATTAQGKLDGEVADLHTNMGSSRTSHSDCRLLEANYTDGKGTQCAEWDSFRKDESKVPDSCASLTFDFATLASEGTLQATMEKCLRDLRPHYEEHIQCKDYTDLLNSKAPVCDTKQTEFEDSFCTYSKKLADTCADQQHCRTTHISYRNETHDDVRKSEVARKADFETGKHILCYFKVFEAANGNKSTTLQECNALVVDSSNLTINYPSIPAPTDCIIAPEEPCDTAWMKTEYDKTWYSNVTMRSCTFCADNVRMAVDPVNDGKKCGDPGDSQRVFHYNKDTVAEASVEKCSQDCLLSETCAAYSIGHLDGHSWCMACKVPPFLSISYGNPTAYKKVTHVAVSW